MKKQRGEKKKKKGQPMFKGPSKKVKLWVPKIGDCDNWVQVTATAAFTLRTSREDRCLGGCHGGMAMR